MSADISQVLTLLQRLNSARIHFSIEQTRDDALCILVAVPGERWEIEFLGDGSVEVERFRSDGRIAGESAIEELLATFSE